MNDLYPRQQTGFWTVLATLAIILILFAVGQEHSTLFVMAVFWSGVGVGMMAGNTRTQRVPGNRRR